MKKNVYLAQQPETYDAIVVGSGIAGGWAAKELTEKGLKTLVLERGRNVEHVKDYITEHKAPWEFELRGNVDPKVLEEDYFIQRRTGFLSESVLHFFFKDSLSPYIEEKPFTWVRGNQVGGKSLMWGRYCFRWSDLDFEATFTEDGGAVVIVDTNATIADFDSANLVSMTITLTNRPDGADEVLAVDSEVRPEPT